MYTNSLKCYSHEGKMPIYTSTPEWEGNCISYHKWMRAAQFCLSNNMHCKMLYHNCQGRKDWLQKAYQETTWDINLQAYIYVDTIILLATWLISVCRVTAKLMGAFLRTICRKIITMVKTVQVEGMICSYGYLYIYIHTYIPGISWPLIAAKLQSVIPTKSKNIIFLKK